MNKMKKSGLMMVLCLVVGLLAMPLAQVSYIGALIVMLIGCAGFSASVNAMAHTAEANAVAEKKSSTKMAA